MTIVAGIAAGVFGSALLALLAGIGFAIDFTHMEPSTVQDTFWAANATCIGGGSALGIAVFAVLEVLKP